MIEPTRQRLPIGELGDLPDHAWMQRFTDCHALEQERQAAETAEHILRSPEVDSLHVNYPTLYQALAVFHLKEGSTGQAAQWVVAYLAFCARQRLNPAYQHDACLVLAQAYEASGDLTSSNGLRAGVACYAPCIALFENGPYPCGPPVLGQPAIPALIQAAVGRRLGSRAGIPVSAPELSILSPGMDQDPASGDWLQARGEYGKAYTLASPMLYQAAADPLVPYHHRTIALQTIFLRAQPGENTDFVHLLRTLLRKAGGRSAAEREFTTFVIALAVDLEAWELLPEIEQAYAGHRVDPNGLDLGDIYDFLNDAPGQPGSDND